MKRVTAVERVQRILTILPWIVENQGCEVDEVCGRFGIARQDLIEDLEFVFVNVGLHPFTPDVLSDVSIEDDRITVHLGDYFHRPLRLTSSEALGLLTAAKAQLRFGSIETDRQDVLASAIDKVSSALGADATGTFEVEFGGADPALLDLFRQANADHRSVAIRYYTYGRDELSERTVDPYRLSNQRGYWYLSAWCHKARALREFRVDRIYSAALTEETFDPPTAPVASSPWTFDSSPRTVEITGDGSLRWITELYPIDEVEERADGQLRVVLPVTATPWLERLLLRLDPSITAVEVPSGESLRSLSAEAARRILGRYDNENG